MGVVVTFAYAAWQAQYPELANVSAPQAAAYFNIATMYQRNDGAGPISDPNRQLTLLGMLVSHIAVLSGWNPSANGGVFDGSAARITGHIENASEGSVSVQTAFDTGMSKSALQAWAIQTTYGTNWWAATANIRTFRYVKGTSYNPAPWIFG